jgi:hypothetical protein
LVAIGNVLFPEDSSATILILAGLCLHFILCFSLSYVLQLEQDAGFAVRLIGVGLSWRKQGRLAFMLFAVAMVLVVHVCNLIILPRVWSMPLLDALLLRTGHVPHICDHIAFGATSAFVLTSGWSESSGGG